MKDELGILYHPLTTLLITGIIFRNIRTWLNYSICECVIVLWRYTMEWPLLYLQIVRSVDMEL